MLIAIIAALGSVALGAALALMPGLGNEGLGRVRTFALIAAITVVLGHLLPEAAKELGPFALLLVMLGVLLPTWLEDAVHRVTPLEVSGWLHSHATGEDDEDEPAEEGEDDGGTEHHHGGHPQGAARSSIGLEIGYAGLVLHHVGDGVALFEYGASARASFDVVLALAAHTIPVIAVVVLQFTALRGRRTALLRAAGLALATVAGSSLGALFPEALERFDPWIAGLVSGLLLHVIAHDLGTDPPRTSSARAVDLGAAALGLAVPLATSEGLDLRFVEALAGLLGTYAPTLLLGLLLAALARRSRARRLFCSARRVLVDAEVLRHAGARPRWVVAFALGASIVRLELLPLAIGFLGPRLTLVWLGSAAVIAVAAGLLVEALRDRALDPAAVEAPTDLSAPETVLDAVDALFHHVGPWMLLGLLAAVYVEMSVPAITIPFGAGRFTALALVTAIAVPSYLAAAAAIPLAAVLIAKGAPIEPVLAGLLLGPMLHLASLDFLARAFGRRAALAGALAVIAATWGLAWAADATIALGRGIFRASGDPFASIAAGSIAAVVALSALAGRAVWRLGPRRWIAGLAVASAATHPVHGHAPAPHVD